MRRAKRALDVCASAAGLVALAPLFLAIGAVVRLDGGPAIFRQERIGRGGRPFRIWKFRTMVVDAERRGPLVTAAGDRRVTRVGAWLRRTKLDELPQLVNVLRGEMSLVGPRPEVARYVAMYSPAERPVLDLTPGVTDPASILYRDEEALLGGAVDPERTYIESVMPAKVRINLRYAARASFLSDLVVVTRTVLALTGMAATTRRALGTSGNSGPPRSAA